MWELYDALIAGIPPECTVDDLVCGAYSVIVKSNESCGFAGTIPGDSRPESWKKYCGMPLRDLAECIKSWNFVEASIGLAAVNAWYNTPACAGAYGIPLAAAKQTEDRKSDPFIMYQNMIRDKNVCVVGHFPYLDKLFAPVCNLAIIETEPLEGDYPESAAAYLLPDAEYVFITCASLVYKSLPGYLSLCRDASVVLVGPSTPLAPVLFSFGIDDISTFIIQDAGHAEDIAKGLSQDRIYTTGRKVSLKKEVWAASQL